MSARWSATPSPASSPEPGPLEPGAADHSQPKYKQIGQVAHEFGTCSLYLEFTPHPHLIAKLNRKISDLSRQLNQTEQNHQDTQAGRVAEREATEEARRAAVATHKCEEDALRRQLQAVRAHNQNLVTTHDQLYRDRASLVDKLRVLESKLQAVRDVTS